MVGDVEASILAVYERVDDPHMGVRNNVTRFMLHYFDRLQSEKGRLAVIEAMGRQLARPSHADRNKAISALHALAREFPDSISVIMARYGDEIRHVAEHSILSNVGGVAKKLLSLSEARSKTQQSDQSD